MNANAIINDNMTLEEKLAAIDSALAAQMGTTSNSQRSAAAPVDPMDDLMCEGCQ